MANFFVRSTDGNDADNGTTWALAKATLAGALAVASAGDTIYVSDNHAETQASAMTLTSPGTAASPCRILCVDDAGDPSSPTTLATTATVTTTGNNAISFAGFAYIYGITFNSSTGGSSSSIALNSLSSFWLRFEACSLRVLNTGSGGSISIGQVSGSTDDNLVEFINTTVQFGAVGHRISVKCRFRWMNTTNAIVGATIPTTLFIAGSGGAPRTEVIGVDLSALGSGKNLVDVSILGTNSYLFVDCKLGSSVAVTVGSVAGQGGIDVVLINCDSADTNYRYCKKVYQGEITQETTIVRSGGASDGTTTVSRKMTTTANSKFFSPLESDWIEQWNETTSGADVIVTIPFISFGAAKLQDDEIWGEAEALETNGFPLGSFQSDRMTDVLATPADQGTDTSTWVGEDRQDSTTYGSNDIIEVQGKLFICTTSGDTAGSEPAGYTTAADGDSVNDGTAVFRAGWRQKAAVTTTPAEKGLIRARLVLAEPSKIVYFDPKLQIA